MGHWCVAFICVLTWLGLPAASARADDLVIPFACDVANGTVRLSRANATLYHIIGTREDLPFSACAPAPSGSCETMMVHKFAINCGGQKVAWSRVAFAARAAGVTMPAELPDGFAPVSRLGGRFVFPGLAPKPASVGPASIGPVLISQVSMQQLSPDGVIEASDSAPSQALAPWVTVVDADAKAAGSDGALQVAGIVTLLIASLMGGCLLAARRRWPSDIFAFAGVPRGFFEFGSRAASNVKFSFGGLRSAFRRSYDSWQASEEPGGGNAHVERAIALVHARLAEAEMLVLDLPADLILRDVLRGELDGLRERAADIESRAGRLGGERASAMLRTLLRDLDRVQRIVYGASPDGPNTPDDAQAPASVSEAYRVLGLNPDAPDVAVKKIVDALRLSWHPDHARSEADRLNRERRIKQINAAWDLLRSERAAAA